MFESTGRRRSTSTSIAWIALISVIPSAPSASQTFAMSAIRVTLGDSFTSSGPLRRAAHRRDELGEEPRILTELDARRPSRGDTRR